MQCLEITATINNDLMDNMMEVVKPSQKGSIYMEGICNRWWDISGSWQCSNYSGLSSDLVIGPMAGGEANMETI